MSDDDLMDYGGDDGIDYDPDAEDKPKKGGEKEKNYEDLGSDGDYGHLDGGDGDGNDDFGDMGGPASLFILYL